MNTSRQPMVIITGASSGVGLYATQALSAKATDQGRAARLWKLNVGLVGWGQV